MKENLKKLKQEVLILFSKLIELLKQIDKKKLAAEMALILVWAGVSVVL